MVTVATFRQILEQAYESNEYNCSGFVRDTATRLGIRIVGDTADAQIDFMEMHWVHVRSGLEASVLASSGFLVVAGVKSTDYQPPKAHGHVVIVRPVLKEGPISAADLDQGKYPRVWGGDIGRTYMTRGQRSVGEILRRQVRDAVRYYTPPTPGPQVPRYE